MRRALAAAAVVAMVCGVPLARAHAAGVRLAFIVDGDVYVREADATVHQLTNFTAYDNTRAEMWSPDGTQIAAIVNDRGNGLVVFATDQASPIAAPRVVIAQDVKNDIGTLDWSPDGTQLVIDEAVSGGERSLVIVDVATGATRVVPGVTDAWAPQFTPDGNRLLFIHGKSHTELATVGRDGSDYRRELADAGLPSPMTDLTYSPDGKVLAVEVFFGTSGAELYVVPVDGSARARSLELHGSEGECSGAGGASWISDNKYLVARFGSCRVGAPPGRFVQVGIDDGSLVTVTVPGFDGRAGQSEVFGDGLVVPIPPPRTATTRATTATTTTVASDTSTSREPTTTTEPAKALTLREEGSDGGGSAAGWLAGGVLLAGSGATVTWALWRRGRARVQ